MISATCGWTFSPQGRGVRIYCGGCSGGETSLTIERMTEPGAGGRATRAARPAGPLSAPPAAYTAAVERYLTGAGIAKSSARI